MTIADRKERDKQKMKEMILQTATQIIIKEGFEKLSIRKIAERIEYSPAIIYHYFSGKNDILSEILRRGHQNMISSLSENRTLSVTPESRLKELIQNYISAALQDPGQYLAVQLNGSPEVLEFTSYMFEGAAEKKPALKILAGAIEEICAGRNVPKLEIEFTAQIIAASTLGFITRLILEREIEDDRRTQLIERFKEAVVGMAVLPKEIEMPFPAEGS